MTWSEFLIHFKRKFYSAENMFESENQLLTLKKMSMTIEYYTNVFTDKMEFSMCIVPDELATIDRYAKGLPSEYNVLVKQSLTFEAVVWAVRAVESMIKLRASDKTEVREKRKFDGSSVNENNIGKKIKF